jgi:hypothetical protein
MNMMNNKNLIPVRLGRLLQSAGIIQPKVLTTALQCARAGHKKIGEVLSESFCVSDATLHAALEVQKLVRESSLSFELAVEALKLVHWQGIGLHQALKRLGWHVEKQIATSDLLSHILVSAGAVTREQLDHARWMAQKKQITFGRALILEAGAAPKLLVAAFDSLVLIRDGKLTVCQAVEALWRVKLEGVPFYEVIKAAPYPVARIGELLTLAGLLTDSDVLHVLEIALLEQKRIGEVLMRSGLVNPVVVDASVRAQSLISQGYLSLSDAIDLLKTVHAEQRSLETLVREMIGIRLQACGLLHQLALIDDAELYEAGRILEGLGDPMLAFALNGRMSGYLLQTAVECSIRVYERKLTLEEALNGLNYCACGQGTLDAYVEQVELAGLKKFFQEAKQIARSA